MPGRPSSTREERDVATEADGAASRQSGAFAPATSLRTGYTAPILVNVVVAKVFPELAARRRKRPTAPRLPAADARAPELADRLLSADHDGAANLINEFRAREGSSLTLFALLFEPAARCMGDQWAGDHCSELEVTLGLAHLQTIVRLLRCGMLAAAPARSPAVLVVPQPGETHRLGLALDTEVMWHAGWDPRCAYPADDEALQALVADDWCDALDLSLSPAFNRSQWLPRVTRTIALARRASRNPELAVVVSGRVFTELRTAGVDTGADGVSGTSLHITHEIRDAIRSSEATEGWGGGMRSGRSGVPLAEGGAPEVRFDIVTVYELPGKPREVRLLPGAFGWRERFRG